MKYTTRIGERPGLAHVNYDCPCGCIAGLTYDRESGSEHVGHCCCGRILWVGDDAQAVVAADQEAGRTYFYESDAVTLPWGDMQTAWLAVPSEWAPKPARAERVLDPVCGMRIDPETAAATTTYNGVTYYFCAAVCKQRFDADPTRFTSAQEASR
jgi:YHS domain-containing protein